MKTIELVVGPSGEITIDAIGFKGVDCEKATAFLEKALGQVSQKQHKPEHRLRAQTKRVQRLQT